MTMLRVAAFLLAFGAGDDYLVKEKGVREDVKVYFDGLAFGDFDGFGYGLVAGH